MAQEDYLKKRVTIYQVSKESGYSLATVSRVINNKDNVTEETKRRVNEIIEKLGYKPSAIAQGLAKSKTTNVGIVIPSSMYTFVSSMLSGMVEIAKIYGYQTTLFVTTPNEEEASEVVTRVISSNVDGAVIFDDQLSDEDIKKLTSYSIPVAVIGREIEGENVASIPLDYANSFREIIVDHFAHSEDEIYFIRLNRSSALIANLEKTACEECKKINKGHLFKIIEGEDSYTRTYSKFSEYFKENRKDCCFIAPRDSIACAIANAALDQGLKIPENIRILSVIGTKYSRLMRPSLTSFDIDMYEVGSIAMRMLTKLLTNTLKVRVYPFTSTIEERNSTRKRNQ